MPRWRWSWPIPTPTSPSQAWTPKSRWWPNTGCSASPPPSIPWLSSGISYRRDTISSGQLKELPTGSTVQLAGIVVARQRPQTAKGYVFVLFEDEDGPINVIVKPDIYKRDRTTIRMEPFVAVRGRLQKDGETINVIAFEVRR